VFGNLPGTRPTVRSPRRDREPGGAPAPKRAGGPTGADPRGQAGARRPPTDPDAGRPKGPAERSRDEAPPEPSPEGGGVEDLAWAGVAVAAEAATLGVRLLSRAMGAVRRPPDRR
jgi:hypothetical protein